MKNLFNTPNILKYKGLEILIFENKWIDMTSNMYVVYKHDNELTSSEVLRMKTEKNLNEINYIIVNTYTDYTKENIIKILNKEFKR